MIERIRKNNELQGEKLVGVNIGDLETAFGYFASLIERSTEKETREIEKFVKRITSAFKILNHRTTPPMYISPELGKRLDKFNMVSAYVSEVEDFLSDKHQLAPQKIQCIVKDLQFIFKELAGFLLLAGWEEEKKI